ncbi:multidrug efflux SMR transporter [Desulfovibrio sp. OttesenSCG-928-I05]|nr:multidrug efflux SMR transporter [Desulfovibrio sp. OttesenSCG-928-I05]
MHWILLFTAIACEALASTALKMTQGFTKPLPSIGVAIALLASLYCSSLALKTISVSIAYALWSGVGMALVVAIAWLWFGQKLDMAAIIGLSFIVLGILILFLFSKSLTY